MPAFTWHHCSLPAPRGGNTPCSSRRKPLKTQSLFPPAPIPIDGKVGSLQELPNVVGHPPALPCSLACKYHGTPSCHSRFLPFSPPGISTFSSLDTACLPTALSFSFLPLSSTLPHGPNPDSEAGQPPHEHLPLPSAGTTRRRRCQGWKCPRFWGSMPPHRGGTPQGSLPGGAVTR